MFLREDPALDMRIDVRAETAMSGEDIGKYWQSLEARADGSFFLSWTWIGSLLSTATFSPTVISAHYGDQLVGLALIGPSVRKRFGFSWPALSINETGLDEYDHIFIEDNGFLAVPALRQAVTKACLQYISRVMSDWSELYISGVPDDVMKSVHALSLPIWRDHERRSYVVEIAKADGIELSFLSSNARQQIRRSVRLYQRRGDLTLTPSADLAEVQRRFSEMKLLHESRFRRQGQLGAFATLFVERFHRLLLTRAYPRGEADILRITAGSETVGLLYTFFYRGDAYLYQNGFAYEADSRLKPGLVSHVLALEHCRQRGIAQYRLLAGESCYKKSLATNSYVLHWLTIRRPRFAFRLEAFARGITGRSP